MFILVFVYHLHVTETNGGFCFKRHPRRSGGSIRHCSDQIQRPERRYQLRHEPLRREKHHEQQSPHRRDNRQSQSLGILVGFQDCRIQTDGGFLHVPILLPQLLPTHQTRPTRILVSPPIPKPISKQPQVHQPHYVIPALPKHFCFLQPLKLQHGFFCSFCNQSGVFECWGHSTTEPIIFHSFC